MGQKFDIAKYTQLRRRHRALQSEHHLMTDDCRELADKRRSLRDLVSREKDRHGNISFYDGVNKQRHLDEIAEREQELTALEQQYQAAVQEREQHAEQMNALGILIKRLDEALEARGLEIPDLGMSAKPGAVSTTSGNKADIIAR